MRKAALWMTVLLTVGAVLCVIAILPKSEEDAGGKQVTEEAEIRTDTGPIYKRFPDLPAAGKILWCSRASGGIGPTVFRIYVFAIYDCDVSAGFPGEEAFVEKTDFYFWPKELAENNSRWRRLEDMGTAFQSGVKNGERIYTDVYINEAGNVIYMEAVWD